MEVALGNLQIFIWNKISNAMRGIIVTVLLVITSFALYSQIGFNKKFNLRTSNSFLGSAINNDTILVLGSTTDFVNGWHFSAIAIDTNGVIINENNYDMSL